MKIKVLSHDDSEEFCRRTRYYTVVDGKEITLAGMALGGDYTRAEIIGNAERRFGADVEIDFSEVCL